MKSFIRCLVAFTAAVLMLTCAAFAEEGAAPGMIGMPNPWTELDSLEALNEAADVNLRLPGVMGVTDISYRLMAADQPVLAELCFSVNGTEYTLRASGEMESDISGVYLDNGETAFAGKEYEGRATVVTDTAKIARWLNISGQYILYVQDEGQMDADTFEGIVDEMMDITNPYQPVRIAGGTYYDTVSQRAYAEVTDAGNDAYTVEIHWSDSCWEDNVWNMTCIVTEDGLLTYHDCVMKHVVTADDGTVTEAEANLNPDGYFEIVGGRLLWTGAADPGCTGCVFELPAE